MSAPALIAAPFPRVLEDRARPRPSESVRPVAVPRPMQFEPLDPEDSAAFSAVSWILAAIVSGGCLLMAAAVVWVTFF